MNGTVGEVLRHKTPLEGIEAEFLHGDWIVDLDIADKVKLVRLDLGVFAKEHFCDVRETQSQNENFGRAMRSSFDWTS